MPTISIGNIVWGFSYIIVALGLLLLTMSVYEAYTCKSQQTTSIISTSRLARFVQSRVFGLQSLHPQASESQGPLLGPIPTRGSRNLAIISEKQTISSSPAEMRATITSHIHAIASSHPRSVYLGRSTFESPSAPSLYAKHKHFTDTTYLGAVCLLDPTNGSLSMRLHPGDIATVQLAGWARKVLGDEVLIHAPRDAAEMQIVRECMDAALGWVCRGEVEEGEDVEEKGSVVRPIWLLPHIQL